LLFLPTALPSATYKGYLLGGLCWFAVPFTMATSMGLAARSMNLPITIAGTDKPWTCSSTAMHAAVDVLYMSWVCYIHNTIIYTPHCGLEASCGGFCGAGRAILSGKRAPLLRCQHRGDDNGNL